MLDQVSSVAFSTSATLTEHAKPETLQKLQQAATDISEVQQLSSSGAAGASSINVGAFARALGSLGQCVEALHEDYGPEIASLKLNMQAHHELQVFLFEQMQEQIQQVQGQHEAAIKPLREASACSDNMQKYGDWVALLREQVAHDLGLFSLADLLARLRHESRDHKHLKWTQGAWHKQLLQILSEMSLTKADWLLLRSFAHDTNTMAHYQALQDAADAESDEGPRLAEEDLQGISMLSSDFDKYKPVLQKAIAIVAQKYGWHS